MDKPKILIAEDDQILLDMYKRKFIMEGFEVRVASDGEEALGVLKYFTPNVIMLDVIMPVKSGTEVLEQLQNDPVLKNIPAIMLTNVATLEIINESATKGTVRWLAKSNNTPNDVVAVVKEVISLKSL
ncbi:MAG: response regulator [Patescibacteria group bacterium]